MVVGVIKAALMVGRRIISGRQALGIEKDMREGLYGHLLRLSFGFYDRHQTGQLMSRATVDLQSVRFFLGFGLIFFFQHILTIVSVMVVLLRDRVAAGADRARDHALDRRRRLPLQPRLAPRAARRPAEARRRRDGHRGVDRRRPRRQVVRAGGAPPDDVRARVGSGLRRDRARVPPARDLRAAALLPAARRAGRRAARRRAHGRQRLADAARSSSSSTCCSRC